jgi:type IV pilus assembly protein PilC
MTTINVEPAELETPPEPGDGRQPPKKKTSIWKLEITKQRVKRRELMHFSQQLAVFVKAGIPLLEALSGISEEMGNKRFREVLWEISEDLRRGSTFSGACDRFPDVFPAYYRGILQSAEMTGNLDTALNRLADYIERDIEARRKVTSALAYPGIVMGFAVIVIIVLTAYVLPRFKNFFDGLDAKLPLVTRMLLAFTSFISSWWFVIAGGFVVLILSAVFAIRTERGRAWADRTLLRLPVLGDVVRYALLERFCRVMSSMMTAGVPLPEALGVTTTALSNAKFREGIGEAREGMMRGEGLARPLAHTGLFPATAKQMFTVGEATGTLDEQLETAASYFDRELDYKIKRFTTLFEPATLIFVGVIVGFVAIALVSAMYGIFREVQV